MIEGYSPVAQAFLGTLFTWGVTALGAALVLAVPGIGVFGNKSSDGKEKKVRMRPWPSEWSS